MSTENDDIFRSVFGGIERHLGEEPGPHPELTDRLMGEGDTVAVSSADRASCVVELPMQPTNQATMECLRGPCIHFWPLTVRYHAMSEKLRIAKIRQCNCHTEPTNLTEQNIYHCGQWWPSWLSWVPVSLRAALRPKIRVAWEVALKKQGYDFSWKTWSDDTFETDRKDLRGDGHLGAHRQHSAVDTQGNKKQGIFFNT